MSRGDPTGYTERHQSTHYLPRPTTSYQLYHCWVERRYTRSVKSYHRTRTRPIPFPRSRRSVAQGDGFLKTLETNTVQTIVRQTDYVQYISSGLSFVPFYGTGTLPCFLTPVINWDILCVRMSKCDKILSLGPILHDIALIGERIKTYKSN